MKLSQSNPSPIYKAIFSDIDGTLINTGFETLPTKPVISSVKKALEKNVHFAVATARPYRLVEKIGKALNLSGPSIVNGGAQIVDMENGKTLWEQPMGKKDITDVITILNSLHVSFFLNDNGNDIDTNSHYVPDKPYGLVTLKLTEEDADIVVSKVRHIPTIVAHKFSWHMYNAVGVNISHVMATKQHAVYEIMKMLQLQQEEIIGIGDSYNDFPLLMAAGLKVAMGNAIEDLKSVADYVAPSVEKNGVAHVIKKFVL